MGTVGPDQHKHVGFSLASIELLRHLGRELRACLLGASNRAHEHKILTDMYVLLSYSVVIYRIDLITGRNADLGTDDPRPLSFPFFRGRQTRVEARYKNTS